jgi:hypothetical protein
MATHQLHEEGMIKPGDMVTCGAHPTLGKGVWLFNRPPDEQFKIHIANVKKGETALVVCVQDTWSNSSIKRHVHNVFVIAHDGVGWCTADRLSIV